MNQPRMTRRTALKGVGAVTIGLPLLEEMLISRAFAAPKADVPVRAFNVFFGLGIPAPLQKDGFDGVLEPLKPLGDKLLILRGVDQVRCDRDGMNAHYDGATGAFTAEPPDGEAKAGGPSIDQVIRKAHYPNGMPAGMVPTLVGGTFFRRSRVGRYVHSYNDDGTVAAVMQETPRDLFERVFGGVAVSGDETDLRRQRLKRSVLDAVVDQYKFYTGNNSPLGATSRSCFSYGGRRAQRGRTARRHPEVLDSHRCRLPVHSGTDAIELHRGVYLNLFKKVLYNVIKDLREPSKANAFSFH